MAGVRVPTNRPQMAAEVHAEYEKFTAPVQQETTNPAAMARMYEQRGEYVSSSGCLFVEKW